MSIEAMKLALEVIRMMGAPSPLHFSKDEIIKWQECNAKLDKAIEQAQKQERTGSCPLEDCDGGPETHGCWAHNCEWKAQKQEPVAMQMDVIVVNLVREGINKHRARELAEHFIKHTSPPQRQPLTDEQREEIAKGWRGRNWTAGDIIDAVEAAHGIKGEA